MSRQTVSRVLKRAELTACRPRKTPLLETVHLKARIAYAKRHIDKYIVIWKHVRWSDQTKTELFGHNNVSCVFRKSGEAFLPKNTLPTVAHGGESSLFWGYFCCFRTSLLAKINGIMKNEYYVAQLSNNLKESARELALGRR